MRISDWSSDVCSSDLTCALEHFTAILANAVLSDPAHLVGADTEAQRMWRWHAVEEIEHKAVAYDTWLYATRAMPRWMSWSLRVLAMLRAAMRFHWVVFRNIRDLLRQDGCNNRATRGRSEKRRVGKGGEK